MAPNVSIFGEWLRWPIGFVCQIFNFLFAKWSTLFAILSRIWQWWHKFAAKTICRSNAQECVLLKFTFWVPNCTPRVRVSWIAEQNPSKTFSSTQTSPGSVTNEKYQSLKRDHFIILWGSVPTYLCGQCPIQVIKRYCVVGQFSFLPMCYWDSLQ